MRYPNINRRLGHWLVEVEWHEYEQMIVHPGALHERMEKAQGKPANWSYAMNKLPDVTLPPTTCEIDEGGEFYSSDHTPFLDTEVVFDIIAEELGEEEAKALVIDTPDNHSCACRNHKK